MKRIACLGLLLAMRAACPAQEMPTAPAGKPVSAFPARPAAAPAAQFSPVIVSENPDVVQRFAVNSAAVRGMLNRSILKLTSATDLGTAWRRLGITPTDIVGIKITTRGGPAFSTHRAILQAICEGLQAAGLPPSRVVLWDKLQDDMVRAGFSPVPATGNHVGVASVFPGTGYDTSAFYQNEMIGTLIWGDSEFIRHDDDWMQSARATVGRHGFGGGGLDADNALDPMSSQTSSKSYYATLVSQTCTKIINVPVLTDNAYIGMEGCLGSLALGSVDNNRRFQGPPTYGDPAICEILDRDFMRHKVIIHILDALVAQYAGGPSFNPLFTQSIGALYVSRDPVAIDSLALPRLERWRKAAKVDPIGKMASHVHDCATYNLGTDDPGRIQKINVP